MPPIERDDNVVLVTVDSLRADHCGWHGYPKTTTPTLDSLAETGLSFEHAVAPGPRTPDSVPAFFTGTDPNVVMDSFADEREAIKDHVLAHQTIPERFSAQGYVTAAFTPNPYTSRYFGYDQLFDHFEDFMDRDRSKFLFERLLEGGSMADTATRMMISGIQRENVFKPWEAYYDAIVKWLDGTEEPYFLWVFLMDCHIPYLAGPGSRTQSWWESYYANLRWYWNGKSKRFGDATHERLVTAYDDAIRYVDKFLRRLRLDADDATLVVTADHGEAFFDHNMYGHPPDHFYSENLHVPLVIHDGETEGTVGDVVSLRQLPDLLTDGHRMAYSSPSPVATASSLATSKFGIRGRHWGYTADDSNDSSRAELDFPPDERPSHSEETIIWECCRTLGKIHREAARERDRIRAATRDFEESSS